MRRHFKPVALADLARGRLQDEDGHLDECADCRAALARVRSAHLAFEDVLESPLPEVGVIRGEATVRWTRLEAPRRVRHPFYVGLGFAAAAAGLLLLWKPLPPSMDQGATVVHLKTPAARETPLQAVVTLLGGVVNVTRGGETARLDPSMPLSRGDRLVSVEEARVAAQWAEGSGFLLLGDSQLEIERLASQEIRLALLRGKIDVRRGPHGPDDALQVIAPEHVVRARGTWFTVAAAQYQTTVEVLEGVVEVSDRQGGASTLLHAPTRAVFGRGRNTQTPISVREAAQLRIASEMNLLSPAALGLPIAGGVAKNALMTVNSDPAGTLAVDSVELGATPLVARQPLGRHYLEIGRHGFVTLRRWVTLGAEPGEVRVALVKSSAPSEVAPTSVPVEIESMIRARSTQIRGCYERRLKRDPSLAGTVSLRLKVGDAGQVQRVDVEESTLDDPMVAECLRKEAMGWSFVQGRNATVVYPFVFRSQ